MEGDHPHNSTPSKHLATIVISSQLSKPRKTFQHTCEAQPFFWKTPARVGDVQRTTCFLYTKIIGFSVSNTCIEALQRTKNPASFRLVSWKQIRPRIVWRNFSNETSAKNHPFKSTKTAMSFIENETIHLC